MNLCIGLCVGFATGFFVCATYSSTQYWRELLRGEFFYRCYFTDGVERVVGASNASSARAKASYIRLLGGGETHRELNVEKVVLSHVSRRSKVNA